MFLFLQITAPSEFQGNIIGDVNRRKGIIMSSEQEGDDVVINVSESREQPWMRSCVLWGSLDHLRAMQKASACKCFAD